MIGAPKYYNTKQDYLNSLELYPEQTKQDLQALLDSRFSWFDSEKLKSREAGITNETHRVITAQEQDENGNEVEVFCQQEYKKDDNSRLFQLGFTVSEINKLIK
ncbi:MAG: hypothetical protein LBT79_08000 [Elusimicrobiota bacterium]|jgi:hypothetical protein|nr:hypothetical protein [Elusimicrobiota bacterium]